MQHGNAGERHHQQLYEPVKVSLSTGRGLDCSVDALTLKHENAALAVENARLRRDHAYARLLHGNMLMYMQAQGVMPTPDAMMGLHGCMEDPWGMMQMAPHLPKRRHDFNATNKVKSAGKQKGAYTMQTIMEEKSNILSFESESTTTGTSRSLQSSIAADDEQEMRDALAASQTTVMLRNIPNSMTRETLLQLINDQGLEGRYTLVYIPIDFKTKVGLGYAFVDLSSHEDAEAFFRLFQGFSKWTLKSDKVGEVTWSALQGVEDHVERYRNSPVMHESVPDEYRPVLFKDGERVPFPEPTKRIKQPRQWLRRH